MSWETRLRAALTEPAYGLAALRVAVVAVLLVTPELRAAPGLASAPELLAVTPEGLRWLAHFRFSPGFVAGAQSIAISAGVMALLGYWARLSCGVFALTATFLLSYSARAGAALHDLHLLWLLALLSASRCGDVWSLDAWGKRTPPPSLVYGAPLCFSRLLLGAVYFFPGVHKLIVAGPAWASAENITALLFSKWFEHGRLPFLRIDAFPRLLALGGAAVLLFELSFWLLALLPKTRVLALVSGLTFHATTQLFCFISSPSLWACFVVLVPWQRGFFGRFTWSLPGRVPRVPWPSIVVAALLLELSILQGARGRTRAFPFACYPTFAGPFSKTAPDLLVELVQPDGSVVRLGPSLRSQRTPQQWSQVHFLLGARAGAATDARLRQFAARRARAARSQVALQTATQLRFLAAEYSTLPSDRGRPPLRTTLLRQLGAGSAQALLPAPK